MSLRAQAAADLQAILENTAEFAWPVTVTDPNGAQASLKGLSNDIHAALDPDTGQLISGRSVSVSLSTASLAGAGLDLPSGTSDTTGRPWVIRFDDIDGNEHTFAVADAFPDRAIGIVVCILEFYSYS